MEQRKVYEFGYTVEGYSPVLVLVGEGSYLLCFNLYFWKMFKPTKAKFIQQKILGVKENLDEE